MRAIIMLFVLVLGLWLIRKARSGRTTQTTRRRVSDELPIEHTKRTSDSDSLPAATDVETDCQLAREELAESLPQPEQQPSDPVPRLQTVDVPKPVMPAKRDYEESFYAKIHGVSHRNKDGTSRQTLLKQCWPGQRLLLIREPDNTYDPDAIEVCRADGKQLGYIGAHVADRDLAKKMDGGAIVTAEIYELTGGSRDKRHRGANILIRIQ